MQVPHRHHFLPEFYLKLWAAGDGRVTEFSRPYGTCVKPRRTHPKGTGYIRKLYSVEGGAHGTVSTLESEFLSPVDSRAAEALVSMRNGANFSDAHRLAWASFIATLLSRMPEDIVLLKAMVQELAETILPSFEPIYRKLKPVGESGNFHELTATAIERSSQRAISHARRIMSNDRLIQGIASMEWSILTLHDARHELLTSDRPVIYTNVLGAEQSHIVLPVGPRLLFVAVKERKVIGLMRAKGQDQLVAATNAAVVGSADKYVYGSTDSQLRFVQNRLGLGKAATLIERMRNLQREKYDPLLQAITDTAAEFTAQNAT